MINIWATRSLPAKSSAKLKLDTPTIKDIKLSMISAANKPEVFKIEVI